MNDPPEAADLKVNTRRDWSQVPNRQDRKDALACRVHLQNVEGCPASLEQVSRYEQVHSRWRVASGNWKDKLAANRETATHTNWWCFECFEAQSRRQLFKKYEVA